MNYSFLFAFSTVVSDMHSGESEHVQIVRDYFERVMNNGNAKEDTPAVQSNYT